MPFDRRRVRAVVAYGLLGAIALTMTAYRVMTTLQGGHPYTTADWLINYGGGFVRRGLFGELFLGVVPPGAAAIWVLMVVQVLLYGVILAFGLWFVRRHDFSWSSIALALGPATLGFMAWDPQAAGRKEVLAYVSLALLVWGLSSAGRRAAVLPVISLVFFAVGVFSWEATVLFLPAVVYLLLRPGTAATLRRWLAVGFVAVGGAGLVLAFLSDRSASTAAAVCTVVKDHGFTNPGICSGAIDWLRASMLDGIQGTADSFPLFMGYVPLLLLAAIPFVLAPWVRRNPVWVVLIAGAFVPLMVIAQDEGRWIATIATALFFCLAAQPAEAFSSRAWSGLAAVLFTTVWGIPHWLPADYAAGWPWMGLAQILGKVLTYGLEFIMR